MSQLSAKPVDPTILLQENRIKEMLENPTGYETEGAAGSPLYVKSKLFAFFQAWELAPETLIPKQFVFTRLRNVLIELLWHRQWREPYHRFIDNTPPKGWQNEGLLALANLIAGESMSKLGSTISGTEEVCKYGDWEKAFIPGLFFSSLILHDNQELRRLIAARSTDFDFLIAYGKKGKRDAPVNLYVHNKVAHAWDNLYIPLRYFSDEAAWSFTKETIGYDASLAAYRKVIRGKDGGLGLRPHPPAVVTTWLEADKVDKTGGSVVISRRSAAVAGLDLQRIKADLKTHFPLRRIRVQ